MKNYLLPIILIISFISCKKENAIEDLELGTNRFDDSLVLAFSIKGTQVDCNTIYLDIELIDENIPEGFRYTHFIIEDPFGNELKTEKQNMIFVQSKCRALSEYNVYLHLSGPSDKRSKAHKFSYRTI